MLAPPGRSGAHVNSQSPGAFVLLAVKQEGDTPSHAGQLCYFPRFSPDQPLDLSQPCESSILLQITLEIWGRKFPEYRSFMLTAYILQTKLLNLGIWQVSNTTASWIIAKPRSGLRSVNRAAEYVKPAQGTEVK